MSTAGKRRPIRTIVHAYYDRTRASVAKPNGS